MKEFKQGIRILVKQPLFAGVAILTLALGIGANVTIFSFVNAILLRPLPYDDSERLVDLTDISDSFGRMSVVYPNFKDWQAMNQTFDDMAAYNVRGRTVLGAELPERILGMEGNANLFPLLGVEAALGRLFDAEDDHGQAAPTVVLSHAFWQRRFGGDPEAIGQTLTMDGDAFTVIGVLPAEFQFPPFQQNAGAVWTALGRRESDDGFMNRRNGYGTAAIGKLKAGVMLAQARVDLDRVALHLEQAYPDTNTNKRVDLNGFRDQMLGNTRHMLTIFMGAVMVVLLIVCVNVAHLLLVRSSARSQEFSVRGALGAGRWHILRQLLCENLVLASLGGLGGVLVALCGIELLSLLLADAMGITREHLSHMDGNVVVFQLAVTLGAGLLFGLFPAWQAARATGRLSLAAITRRTTASKARGRVSDALVMAEIALALVLLCGAGLMVRSFVAHLQADPGYDPQNVVMMNLTLPYQYYGSRAERIALYQTLLQDIEALPGVAHVGLGTNPLGHMQSGYYVENSPIPETGQSVHAEYNRVTPGYCAAMGIRLLEGRHFLPSDTSDTPLVAMVDQRFAERWWPNESAVGKRVQLYRRRPDPNGTWAEVIGVVAHVKHYGVDRPSRESLFLSAYQSPRDFLALIVRTQGDPLPLVTPIRQAVARIAPEVPTFDVSTLQSIRDNRASRRRAMTTVLGGFAAAALLLAALGIYGVTAYTVSQRTQEFGIRMALGARINDILHLVLGRGMKLALPGLLLGLIASFVLGWMIRSLLFGVASWDPLTFIAVSAILVVIVMLACYIPARRAARIEPIEALRYE